MWTTIFLVISIVLLAASLILSTASSSAYQKMETETARSYYVWAMVMGGACMITLVTALIIYLSTAHTNSATSLHR